jgi:hypothetical protein
MMLKDSKPTPVRLAEALRITLAVALVAAVTATHPAAAADLDTGDLEAPPPGANVGLAYYQHASRAAMYAQGDKVLGNAQLSSDVALLRYMRTVELAGVTFGPQLILPVGRLSANGDIAALGNTTGVGDLVLASPIWLVNRPTTHTYFAVVPYLYVPIGSYDHSKALNLGENRWRATLQVGGELGLPGNFAVEAMADATAYLENGNFGPGGVTRKQAPLFEGQLYLSYLWTSATRLALGTRGYTGGETTVAGVAQNDRTQTLTASVTAATFVDPQDQVMFTVGRDLAVRNGLAENFRFNFRYLRLF